MGDTKKTFFKTSVILLLASAILLAACDSGSDSSLSGPSATCGNNICEGNEDSSSCPNDCLQQVSCGDGICSQEENPNTCQTDCPPSCGDGFCTAPHENYLSCPSDCIVSLCGDGVCDSTAEDSSTCPADCPAAPAQPIPNKLYVVHQDLDSVSVIDLDGVNQVVEAWDGVTPTGVFGDSSLNAFITKQITVGDMPTDIAVYGDKVYVINQLDDSVTIIDAFNDVVFNTIQNIPNPQGIVADNDGMIFVLSNTPSGAEIYMIDSNNYYAVSSGTTTLQSANLVAFQEINGLQMLYLVGDDGVVKVIDSEALIGHQYLEVGTVTIGTGASSIGVDPNGKIYITANEIGTANDAVSDKIFILDPIISVDGQMGHIDMFESALSKVDNVAAVDRVYLGAGASTPKRVWFTEKDIDSTGRAYLYAMDWDEIEGTDVANIPFAERRILLGTQNPTDIVVSKDSKIVYVLQDTPTTSSAGKISIFRNYDLPNAAPSGQPLSPDNVLYWESLDVAANPVAGTVWPLQQVEWPGDSGPDWELMQIGENEPIPSGWEIVSNEEAQGLLDSGLGEEVGSGN